MAGIPGFVGNGNGRIAGTLRRRIIQGTEFVDSDRDEYGEDTAEGENLVVVKIVKGQ
jgi:hypothetical protein